MTTVILEEGILKFWNLNRDQVPLGDKDFETIKRLQPEDIRLLESHMFLNIIFI